MSGVLQGRSWARVQPLILFVIRRDFYSLDSQWPRWEGREREECFCLCLLGSSGYFIAFEEATSWPGHLIPPFLLSWCAGVLRVPALHLVAFWLMMWNYKWRDQKWRRRWQRGLPACPVPVGAGASTGRSLRRQTAMTLIVHHSTGTLALNNAQGLQLDQCISGFRRRARESLIRQHKPQRYEGLTAAVLGKVLGEGCFGRSHPRHPVLGITAL